MNDELEARVELRTMELDQSRLEMLSRLALASEFRDDHTGQHTRRVGRTTAALASRLGVTDDEGFTMALAAPLSLAASRVLPSRATRPAAPQPPSRSRAIEGELRPCQWAGSSRAYVRVQDRARMDWQWMRRLDPDDPTAPAGRHSHGQNRRPWRVGA
jgi:hypothetical protein